MESTSNNNEIYSFNDDSQINNQIEKLKDNLMLTTFNDSVEALKIRVKKNNENKKLLKKLKKKQHLDKSLVHEESEDYIYQQYLNACNHFKRDLKVSIISYGLTIIDETIYLYLTKENDLSLKYIKNYRNITPIEFNEYIEDLSSKEDSSDKNKKPVSNRISITEKFGEAGLTVNGYSLEFNINYFLKAIGKLVKLPNLLFDLNKNYKYKGFYHEMDISYFNSEKLDINNKEISLFRTNACFSILNKKITIKINENLVIQENSLVLGEVKSRFPRRIKPKKNMVNLKDIIDGLFYKLNLFYDLFIELKEFSNYKAKYVQIILFYDFVQLTNLKLDSIKDIIQNNLFYLKVPNYIEILFYIVITLPSITNVSIDNLTNEIDSLKNEKEVQDKEIKKLEKTINTLNIEKNKLNIKIDELNTEINELKERINKIMPGQTNGNDNNIPFNNNTTYDLSIVLPITSEEKIENQSNDNWDNNLNNIDLFYELNNNNENLKGKSNLQNFNNEMIDCLLDNQNETYNQNKELNNNLLIFEQIKNKFNDFMLNHPNSENFKDLIFPPHNNLTQMQLNVLNDFMDNLSNEELNAIISYECFCEFCGICRLKVTLSKIKNN